jgi:hypothetical protein
MTTEDVAFSTIKKQTRARFDGMLERSNQAGHALLVIDYDRDAIWEAYLSGFPEDQRQEHNCNCCKSFIRQIGGAVLLTPGLDVVSVWSDDSPSPSVRALAAYVKDKPIAGLFYHDNTTGGTDKNLDAKRQVVWEHFHVQIPSALVNDEKRGNLMGKRSADVRETRNVLKRGLEEFTTEAIVAVQELIAQGSLYRGAEQKHAVDEIAQLRHAYHAVPPENRELLAWKFAMTKPAGICRIRNTSIGTLLVDLSTGRDVEEAVKAYERIVAPANYKRPTALVTPRMVEDAKARLTELGLISALNRRRLDDRDLTAAHALYVYRPTQKTADPFAQITQDQPVNVKELKKVEEIGIEAFLTNVLPGAHDVRVLVERQHLGNFVTLTGAVDPEANNLMKWDNSFGWSYTGGLADSIKEKVKAAGGRVDGWMRASLAWYNYDDLDLHFKSDRELIYYGNKRGHDAWLDVDMNAGGGKTREPVENITVTKQLVPGNYAIRVNQFSRRESTDVGYELEIEVNGETHSFGSAKSPRQNGFDDIAFKVLPDGQVTFETGGALTKTSSGVTKWGIKTGQFQRVRAITLSPNHWTRPIGNRHFMFLLDGCMSDEQTRPFLNEQLVDALTKDRKVLEALGSKIEVAPAQGAELSGVGFSDTQRNHLYVEVEGAFKRTLKVLF